MSDYFRKVKSLYSSTTNSFGVGEAETITPASVTGLPTDTEMVLTFDRSVTGKIERIKGTITGGNFVISSGGRGYDGTTEQAHTSPTVEYIPNAADTNDFVTGVLVEHGQTGVHDATKVAMLAGTQTVTGAKTFGAGLLKATSPQITTGINDSGGNELIKVTATGSAVNEITLANAATTGSPTISATGGDDNVGIDVKMKGTGKFRKPTLVGIQVVDSSVNTAVGDGKAYFRIPAEMNGMNLTGVAATVYTAGTTGTTDIQLRNKTDTADMLSTKLTIDASETDSSTAEAAAVIDTTKDDVVTGDVIAIDIDAISTTPAKGLYVEMRFELP